MYLSVFEQPAEKDLCTVLLKGKDVNPMKKHLAEIIIPKEAAVFFLDEHGYWRHKGLAADLVIWAEAYAGYRQSLLDAIVGLVHAGTEAKILDQPGGTTGPIFPSVTDRNLFST